MPSEARTRIGDIGTNPSIRKADHIERPDNITGEWRKETPSLNTNITFFCGEDTSVEEKM